MGLIKTNEHAALQSSLFVEGNKKHIPPIPIWLDSLQYMQGSDLLIYFI